MNSPYEYSGQACKEPWPDLPRTPERGYVYEYFVRDRLTPAETVGYVPNMTYDRYIPPQQQVEAPPVDEPIIVQSTEESAS